MSESISTNKALMRRIYEEMWNKGDPAVAGAIFAQPEGVQKFVRGFLAAFPDLKHTVEAMVEEGDRVVVQFSAQGTHKGKWLDFEPTNKSVRYTGVTLARISGDKVVDHTTWWDKAGLLEQITAG